MRDQHMNFVNCLTNLRSCKDQSDQNRAVIGIQGGGCRGTYLVQSNRGEKSAAFLKFQAGCSAWWFLDQGFGMIWTDPSRIYSMSSLI